MSTGTPLLNDDGAASMATAMMMSHHAFRRDIASFTRALEHMAAGDTSRSAAVATEWKSFRAALHGHHFMEDSHIFPDICTRGGPAVASVVDQLSAQHRQIDPLLGRGDLAFESLPASVQDASAVVRDIRALLDEHLALEEPTVLPFLRDARSFPPPPTEADSDMYAHGFAWSSRGIADGVLRAVYAMLTNSVAAKLPAAREAYTKRAQDVWGTAEIATSRTSVPVG